MSLVGLAWGLAAVQRVMPGGWLGGVRQEGLARSRNLAGDARRRPRNLGRGSGGLRGGVVFVCLRDARGGPDFGLKPLNRGAEVLAVAYRSGVQ